jgi:6,7-dimethyl-8-ribityllumazine synthase
MDIKEYNANPSLDWLGNSNHHVKIGIVVSRFNYPITSNLLEGAKIALNTASTVIDEVNIFWVPGSFEIPVVAKRLANGGWKAIICLGAVIRGETDHYEYIAQAVSRGLTDVAVDTLTPIIFGVLTVDNLKQAYARSGGEDGRFLNKPLSSQKNETKSDSSAEVIGNAGYSAGIAALEMISFIQPVESE